MTTAVTNEISEFCKELLRARFPSQPAKQKLVESDPDSITMACPYCGDSAKDPNKKRGHLYLKSGRYKCYNDGCSILVPIDRFIKHFSTKFGLEPPSVRLGQTRPSPAKSKKGRGSVLDFLLDKRFTEGLMKIDQVAYQYSLRPCHEASPDSPVGEFIAKRALEGLPVFERSCYFDSSEDKVYLFNTDVKSGRILGFAIRRIHESAPGPKYDIRTYSELRRSGLFRELDEEFVKNVDGLNNFFNVLNINFAKTVTITEGQFDSMFVRNAIATTGVTKGRGLIESLLSKRQVRILFDNDRAGKIESISMIKKGYSVFLWNRVTQDLRKEYPEAQGDIKKVKDVNDLYCFLRVRRPDLDFEVFNRLLDKYFSDSPFDILYI